MKRINKEKEITFLVLMLIRPSNPATDQLVTDGRQAPVGRITVRQTTPPTQETPQEIWLKNHLVEKLDTL